MQNVVYDTLHYYMTCDNGVIIEGYDGYIITENKSGKYFVTYKEVTKNGDIEKRYVIPNNEIETFMKLEEKYKNFFEKQKFLEKMFNEVLKQVKEYNEDSIKEICNEVYSIPDNYINFIAINVTKNEFFLFVKNRLDNNH